MTEVLTVDARSPEPDRIRTAAAVLRRGGLVAFPTETVYGLGAHALDADAVARIFAAKGRPSTDPVIVHIAHADQMRVLARHIPDVAWKLAARFWPGPLTLIVEKAALVPDNVTAGRPTVAIRVPSHAVARALLEEAALPIAAPSANRFSRPSPTRAEHVITDLEGRIDVVLDGGPTPIGVESTILDLTVTPPLIRRPGGVSWHEVQSVIADVQTASHMLTSTVAQPSPGQLLRHYAPRAETTLYIGPVEGIERLASDIRTAVAAGKRVGVLAPEEDLRALAPRLAAVGGTGRVVTQPCGTRRDRAAAARDLFVALRTLDARGVDVIFASAPPGDGIDAAILDRLTRAAEGRIIRT